MHRLSLFFLVVAFALGLLGISAAAQEGTPGPELADCIAGRMPESDELDQLEELGQSNYLAWEGVCQPIPEGTSTPAESLPDIIDTGEPLPAPLQDDFDEAQEGNPAPVFQRFDVALKEDFAAIPVVGPTVGEEIPAEFMVVRVVQGTFVLDLQLDDQQTPTPVYVITADANGNFTIMNPWTLSTPMPHYTPTENVLQNADGTACTAYCEVIPGQPVQLEQGDLAIAARGALCTYCLEQSAIDENGIHGLLEVYPLIAPNAIPDGFSWRASWDGVQAGGGRVEKIDEPIGASWSLAFFGTGCKDH